MANLDKQLQECFNDELLAYITPESVKQFSEVVRDVFPHATKEQICGYLQYWEADDTPETFYQKLKAL